MEIKQEAFYKHEGDRSKWIPAKTFKERIKRAFTRWCHKPCGGMFYTVTFINFEGFKCDTFDVKCDRCGATYSTYEY